jgi:hypothetical protein
LTAWTVENTAIRIVDRATGEECVVGYPEAALWDMLMLGYSFDAMLDVVTRLIGCSRRCAGALMRRTIRIWEKKGFLTE